MGSGASALDKQISLKKKGLRDLETDLKRLDLIEKMTRVEKIHLQNNKLTILSPKILKDVSQSPQLVECIREVNLHNNRLTLIPAAFFLLVNMTRLRLDHNMLDEVPPKLSTCLYKLERLQLNHNNITELPWNFNNMRRLTTLYIHNNAITFIPNTIAELELTELSYHNNPLRDTSLFSVPTLEVGLDQILNQKIPPEYRLEVRQVLQLDGKDGKTKTQEELIFETLLKSDELIKPFRQFLEKEYSHENLMFYERAELFFLDFHSEAEITSAELQTQAKAIVAEYVSEKGEHVVNIPSNVANKLLEENRVFNQWSFEDAKAHVFLLMFTDIFQRFRHTPESRRVIGRGKKIVRKWLRAGGVISEGTSASSTSPG
eukprot:TRINITY_DN2880_c0_g1_i1.p1 TRINITY_DN2880_c0_g1~~TRINITY_DN2880_c0_g1_i1.p1  ORF type:complete len:412 (+),score=106.95 TRINITY_DN2880_c0_g1_i1:116-1237(+)